jgi:hypothetical protein
VDSVFISLLPFIIGSALVPVQIIIVVLLLTGEKNGLFKAIVFVLGMTFARLAQGIVFGFVFTSGSGDPAGAAHSVLIKAALLIVLGIMLLVTAYKKWDKAPDPDAPPPKWMTMLDGLTPLRALLMGAGFIFIAVKLWVFTLGTLNIILEAQIGQPGSTFAFLLYILLAQSLLILPILIRLFLPKQAAVWLRSFGDWLERNNNTIVIIVSLVFGVLFLYQGISAFF